MQQGLGNPGTNHLQAGVSEADLRTAVDDSGYPLQVIVSQILRASFSVQEEWAYIDRDTRQLRSLDIRAVKWLSELSPQERVRPVLNLLVECKHSELPYVFFESKGKFQSFDHPVIHGLKSTSIYLDSDSGFGFTVANVVALGLLQHPFQSVPKISRTFSKAVRSGKKLELSGTEAYSASSCRLLRPSITSSWLRSLSTLRNISTAT